MTFYALIAIYDDGQEVVDEVLYDEEDAKDYLYARKDSDYIKYRIDVYEGRKIGTKTRG